MKFLIALQFYGADRDRAMRLARLIADIEQKPREDVEFLFVARFDCEHDHETIKYVSQKFPTHWITTHTKWTGWPGGCNGCARDLLEWAAVNRRQATGLLMFEPDCVPTSIDWLDRIIAEWDTVRDRTWQMGAWRESGGQWGHVNGNCVIAPWVAIILSGLITDGTAWDCEIAPWVQHRWHKTGLIRNLFESRNATAKDLFWTPIGETTPALVHGFKDDSAYNLAVKNLLNPTQWPELSL